MSLKSPEPLRASASAAALVSRDIILLIFEHLSVPELLRASCVCRAWNSIARLAVKYSVRNLSEGASSSKKPAPSIYSNEVGASAFALMNILEEPLTKRSFTKMKFILANLHEQTIPQALSSACALLNLDFWHDWEEYEDAYADQEALVQHIKHMKDAPPSQGLDEERTKLEAEIDEIDNEISFTEAEILRLQARVASLQEARANKENKHEKFMERGGSKA